MTTKIKVALLVAIAAAVGVAVWNGAASPPVAVPTAAQQPAAVGPASASVAAAPPQGAPTEPPADAASARVLAPTTTPTTGALAVHVTWGEDGTPASEVKVWVGSSDSALPRKDGMTNARGVARFADLPAGRYEIALSRLAQVSSGEIDVEVGQLATIQLSVPSGLDVSGSVVDGAGAPINDAIVVVGNPGDPRVTPITRTGIDGRFAVRDLTPIVRIGARATGRAPSPLQQLAGSRGAAAEVRFVLDQQGAALIGKVFDGDSHVIAGARVSVSSESGRYDAATAEADARTEADGGFTLDGLPVGGQRLCVVADGFATWANGIALHVGTNTQDVFLVRGATVIGVARTADGGAVVGADVRSGNRATDTGKDGAFTLTGLPGGEFEITVYDHDLGERRATLRAAPGETVRWDPVLATGLVVRGRVVDDSNAPVADAHIDAVHRGGNGRNWSRSLQTRDDGSFQIADCEPGATLRLDCSRGQFPELRTTVSTDSRDLVLRLPPATAVRMVGTVVDSDGKPMPMVRAFPVRAGGGRSEMVINKLDGTFALGPYPVGEYAVTLIANGFARHQTAFRVLSDGEVWDLGSVRLLRGGTLHATLVGPRADLADRTLLVASADDAILARAELHGGVVQSTERLASGEWLLRLMGPDVGAQQIPFTIRDGEETRIDIAPARGTEVRMRFAAPTGVPATVSVRVTDPAGHLVLRDGVWLSGPSTVYATMLLPGRYRVAAELQREAGETAIAGRAEFDVGEAALTVDVALAAK